MSRRVRLTNGSAAYAAYALACGSGSMSRRVRPMPTNSPDDTSASSIRIGPPDSAPYTCFFVFVRVCVCVWRGGVSLCLSLSLSLPPSLPLCLCLLSLSHTHRNRICNGLVSSPASLPSQSATCNSSATHLQLICNSSATSSRSVLARVESATSATHLQLIRNSSSATHLQLICNSSATHLQLPAAVSSPASLRCSRPATSASHTPSPRALLGQVLFLF